MDVSKQPVQLEKKIKFSDVVKKINLPKSDLTQMSLADRMRLSKRAVVVGWSKAEMNNEVEVLSDDLHYLSTAIVLSRENCIAFHANVDSIMFMPQDTICVKNEPKTGICHVSFSSSHQALACPLFNTIMKFLLLPGFEDG